MKQFCVAEDKEGLITINCRPNELLFVGGAFNGKGRGNMSDEQGKKEKSDGISGKYSNSNKC